MADIRIEKLHDECFITTYFNDGYTPPTVWNKTFKTIKGAENYLREYLKMSNQIK